MQTNTATFTGAPRRQTRRPPARPLAVPVNEACQIGGFGRTLCYELIRDGKLKSVALGRRRLVLVESIESLLKCEAV